MEKPVEPKGPLPTPSKTPIAVSGDVTIGSDIKVGDVVGGAPIVTGDTNSIIISYSRHDIVGGNVGTRASSRGDTAKVS
jgi:hypothetical protein